MRKLQSLSVGKVVQLCLLLSLAVFCVIGLKSFFGGKNLESNYGLQRILKEDYAEADNTLHDAPEKPAPGGAVRRPTLPQPSQKDASTEGKDSSRRGDHGGEEDYPGFVQPNDQTGVDVEPTSAETSGTISKKRTNVRRKFLPSVREDPFKQPDSGGKTINPAIQQFLSKIPPFFPGGVQPSRSSSLILRSWVRIHCRLRTYSGSSTTPTWVNLWISSRSIIAGT